MSAIELMCGERERQLARASPTGPAPMMHTSWVSLDINYDYNCAEKGWNYDQYK